MKNDFQEVARRTFWRTTLVLVAIVGFAIIGGALVYDRYSKVQRDIVSAEVSAFRNAFVVARDLQRFGDSLDAIINADVITDALLEEALDALDFLYVRNDGFKRNSDRLVSGAANPAPLIEAIDSLVTVTDTALSAPLKDIPALLGLMSVPISEVNRQLLIYVDDQYFRQSQAIRTQGETLEQISILALGIFAGMSFVAIGAVLMYRRALLAQARRVEAEKKARFLAYFDPMTGLPNRSRFRDVSEAVFRNHDDPLVLLLDLDGFKGINDTYGHATGDAALIRAANCISAVVTRYGGTAARLGGDEFAAILPGPVSSMKAAAICEEILSDCAEPFEAENARLSIGLSIGIAFAHSVDAAATDLISSTQKAADTALYRAKENGKRTYAFYDADLAELVERRRSIEVGIDEGLRNGDFWLAFQPQIDLQTGETKGFEALCRWTRDGQLISPGEFISVAEATGQVVDIDIWGLREALRTLAGWIRDDLMPVTMSANLSPLHFRNDTIVTVVEEVLAETGLPPGLVTLEITESILIDDVSLVTSILDRLRALGVRLALDDFGTGYSSLAYLRTLNVDFIKIDQSFVRNLEQDAETGVILNSLVSLAQGLGKKLVVEGVETEPQAQIVAGLGCDVAQGYLYGKPLPVEDARARIPHVSDALQRRSA